MTLSHINRNWDGSAPRRDQSERIQRSRKDSRRLWEAKGWFVIFAHHLIILFIIFLLWVIDWLVGYSKTCLWIIVWFDIYVLWCRCGNIWKRKKNGLIWSGNRYIYLIIVFKIICLEKIIIFRREKRVGNWREFQEDPESKKIRLANFKEEHRADEKHGTVKLEEWKRKWKWIKSIVLTRYVFHNV